MIQLSGCGPSGGSGASDRDQLEALLLGIWIYSFVEKTGDSGYQVLRVNSARDVTVEGFHQNLYDNSERFVSMPYGKFEIDAQGDVDENGVVKKFVFLRKITEVEAAERKTRATQSIAIKKQEIIEMEKILLNKSLVLEKETRNHYDENNEVVYTITETADEIEEEVESESQSGDSYVMINPKRVKFISSMQVLLNDKKECDVYYTKWNLNSPSELSVSCSRQGDPIHTYLTGVVSQENGKIIFTETY